MVIVAFILVVVCIIASDNKNSLKCEKIINNNLAKSEVVSECWLNVKYLVFFFAIGFGIGLLIKKEPR